MQRELKKIQAHFPALNIPTFDLIDEYAEMLRQASEDVVNPEAPPEKLVTDLLIRCVIWAELIQQQ